jgi:hypothetical protein
MTGVSRQQHFGTQSVAAGARGAVALGSFVVGICWATAAGAAAPDADAPRPAIAPLAVPQRQSYSLLLGSAYVAAPLLALAVGGGLAELEADDTVAVLGGASMFLLPAIVHIAHGNDPHGALSFLEVAGSTGLGALVGGVVGYTISYASCPEHDSERCDFAGLPGLFVGSLLGGVTGYTAYAVYDVSSNASVLGAARRPSPAVSLQLWLQPLPARRSLASEVHRSMDGLQLGATLRM